MESILHQRYRLVTSDADTTLIVDVAPGACVLTASKAAVLNHAHMIERPLWLKGIHHVCELRPH